MRVDVVETATTAAETWCERWFPGWFAAVDAGAAAGHADPVLRPREELLAWMRRSSEAHRRFALCAVEADEVLGGATVDMPQLDNKELALVTLDVAPWARRRGVGTALLRAVRDLAVDHGRTSVLVELDRPFDEAPHEWPGTAFAAARGLTLRLASIRRDLALPVPPEVWSGLEAEAGRRSAGYRVLSWAGRCEDKAQMAQLMARMTTDAPMGDLDYEPEAWDDARVAEHEDYEEGLGRRWWTSVAVAPDGQWAAFSTLGWTPHEPDRLHQWDTLVLAEHRGHRLGLLLKLETLRLALTDAPAPTRVTTWNAASNAPMIAVNEMMGFRAVESGEEWQADLTDLRL